MNETTTWKEILDSDKAITIVTADDDVLFMLANMLELELKCFYCGDNLVKGNIGGIFPDKKIVCKSILCQTEYIVKENPRFTGDVN